MLQNSTSGHIYQTLKKNDLMKVELDLAGRFWSWKLLFADLKKMDRSEEKYTYQTLKKNDLRKVELDYFGRLWSG